jgi:hypothetical protein
MMGNNMFDHSMWAGHWLWMLIMAVVLVIPIWRICQRAGYPGWLGLLIVVPFVNLGLLYFLAFSNWPARKRGEQDV